MNATIEALKADALRGIRESRPRLCHDGKYVCPFCGTVGDKGWSVWHNCDERKAHGIKVRIVR